MDLRIPLLVLAASSTLASGVRADRLEPPHRDVVRCELPVPLPPSLVPMRAYGTDGLAFVRWTHVDLWHVHEHAWQVEVQLPGHLRMKAWVEDGVCTRLDIGRIALVRGRVTNGPARIRVGDHSVQLDADGTFGPMYVPAGQTYQVEARRSDGAFDVVRRAEFDAVTGATADVTIELPAWRAAGFGIQLATHTDSIEISDVMRAGHAAEVGIRPGDVIVAVDGVLTRGLTPHAFVDAYLGPAGTEAELWLERGERELVVTVQRRELEYPAPDDWLEPAE